MTQRLPWLVLVATLGAVAAAAVFARKPSRLPAPRPAAAWTGDVDRLRELRKTQPSLPAGGLGHPEYGKRLDGVRAANPAGLDLVILDKREDRLLRVDLLQALAAQPGDLPRRLSGTLASDPEEPAAVRLAALSVLMTYRDAHTFDILRALWESRRPFDNRAFLCTALGECGQPGAIPLLKEALGVAQPLDVRSHAALALGAFADDPTLRAELLRLSKEDASLPVRENALRALARSAAGEAELRAVEDPALKSLAEELLRGLRPSSPRERKAR